MASIYINYPNAQVTVHHDPACPFTKRASGKRRDRKVKTALDGIRLIRDIEEKKIKFKSVAGSNDLWVTVSDDEASGVAREIAVSMRRSYRLKPGFPLNDCC